MALSRVLTLRRSRSDRLEGRRVLIQLSSRPEICLQGHLWGMIRPCAGHLRATVRTPSLNCVGAAGRDPAQHRSDGSVGARAPDPPGYFVTRSLILPGQRRSVDSGNPQSFGRCPGMRPNRVYEYITILTMPLSHIYIAYIT
jgi:hypothetical protein